MKIDYNILSKVDHTNLKVDAADQDIIQLCDEAIKYKAASVCVAPGRVSFVKDYFKSKQGECEYIPDICTVIGFPNGYSTTMTKVYEATDAINNGADELDVVININDLKNGRYENIEKELAHLARISHELRPAICRKVVKVIIETCLLTDEEKRKMCEICLAAGVDYIKTSTGFSTGGATLEDVRLFKETIGDRPLKIKAAGGMSGYADAVAFIEAGADRLGTSRVIKELENINDSELTY